MAHWFSLSDVQIFCLLTVVCTKSALAAPVRRGVSTPHEIHEAKMAILQEETKRRLGGTLVLNDKEKMLNEFLMMEKQRLIDGSRSDKKGYQPAKSFFKSKQFIDGSTVFKIIKDMPKGCALHLHDLAITSLDWVIKNATYRDNVYMYRDEQKFVRFGAFKSPPKDKPWKSVKEERAAAPDVKAFDESLKKSLSLLSSDPLVTYPTLSEVWGRFNLYFEQVIPLLFNADIMRDYYRRALGEFRADNVQYMELRGLFSGFTDSDGNVHDAEYGVELYDQVTQRFVKDFYDVSGAKVILSGLRFRPANEIAEQVFTTTALRKKYPDFVLGYDLVGQEDPNHPLSYYMESLLKPGNKLPYFFHAAETNWQDTEVDYNLIDALLLNTTRIGHAYGLIKHPKILEMVKQKGIAVEINPISNQLLGLVSDLRNHPMAFLAANDYPLVVSSDDPAAWEAAPLSHDFFVAFMDMSGRDADLTFLKQLALNSFKYNAMSKRERAIAVNLWEIKWKTFIDRSIRKWLPWTLK